MPQADHPPTEPPGYDLSACSAFANGSQAFCRLKNKAIFEFSTLVNCPFPPILFFLKSHEHQQSEIWYCAGFLYRYFYPTGGGNVPPFWVCRGLEFSRLQPDNLEDIVDNFKLIKSVEFARVPSLLSTAGPTLPPLRPPAASSTRSFRPALL